MATGLDEVWRIGAFAAAMTLSPGPNNLMLTASGASFGFRRSIPPWLGVCLGIALLILSAGVGLGAIFLASPMVQVIMKALGVLYVLWLASKIARVKTLVDARVAKPVRFLQAVLLQLVNPKVWTMAISAVSAYTVAGSSIFAQVGLVAAIFGVVALPMTAVWTLFGAGIRRHLRNERVLRAVNLGLAGLLVASIVPIVFDSFV